MGAREWMESMCRNAIRLEIHGTAAEQVGQTRFGGRPDVPRDFVWPRFESRGRNGVVRALPLTFLVQFRCGDLAPLDAERLLPQEGVLSFFYELESQCWGFDPEDRGCARVFWFPDQDLAPADFPEDLSQEGRLPCLKIGRRAAASYPAWEDVPRELSRILDDVCEDYYEIRARLEDCEEGENCSKLLGWPDIIQSNMTLECELIRRSFYLGGNWRSIDPQIRAEAEAASQEQWRLLLQLDTVEQDDFELMFGDGGRLYFYIRKEDLQQARFDRVWLILQCY